MTTPSPTSISFYITNCCLFMPIDVQKEITNTDTRGVQQGRRTHYRVEVNKNNLAIDLETECPRCHDIMTLCSDFDKLCYTCEECSFLLALNHSL